MITRGDIYHGYIPRYARDHTSLVDPSRARSIRTRTENRSLSKSNARGDY